MKHLRNYKSFESVVTRPQLRFPTEKAVHVQYLIKLLEDAGLDADDLNNKDRDGNIFHFFNKKCSKENIVFPLKKETDIMDSAEYREFIFGSSVFLIPSSYDSKDDLANFTLNKISWIEDMKDMMKDKYKTKEEMDKFENDLETRVRFGPSSYEWINPSLKIIHDKLSQFYINGKLRVWYPEDMDYDYWEGNDYPHKYNIVGELSHPNGVYYLSDLEKFIENKYGLKDPELYDFILKNHYIEGRYWERVWSFPIDDKTPNKIKRINKSGSFGMDATESLNDILNVIEHEFQGEVKRTKYEGFPIYVDYYKKDNNE